MSASAVGYVRKTICCTAGRRRRSWRRARPSRATSPRRATCRRHAELRHVRLEVGVCSNTCAGTTWSRRPGNESAAWPKSRSPRRSVALVAPDAESVEQAGRVRPVVVARVIERVHDVGGGHGWPSDHDEPRAQVVDPNPGLAAGRPPAREAGCRVERLRVERGERRVLRGSTPRARSGCRRAAGSSEPMFPRVPTVRRSGLAAPRRAARPRGGRDRRERARRDSRAPRRRAYARRHFDRARSRMIWRVAFEPGNAGDAAAAVGRAARLVEARRSACGSRRSPARAACGRAGRARARRGRCCRRCRPYSCSISYGPITWRCRIESVKPGATASTRAITRSAYGSSSSRSCDRGPRVRHPLREHRHDVLPVGRERRVEHRRDADVGEGERGGAPGHRVLERALDVVERLREHDRAAVHFGIEAGLRGELGQPVDGDVDLHRSAARLPAFDRGDEVGGQARRGRSGRGT